MSVSYNPFSREFSEIEAKDLATLREVTEGWHVEYKRERKPQKDIAKSLAAFANHYGGWIFYGIEQASDRSNKAGLFPGIAKADEIILIEHLRNAAKDNINPSPYYEHRIFNGPCNEIGLPQDKSIVAVYVPSGSDTPYIHGDGKIYRRIADSSDPKPETDRFILDHLWQRRLLAYTKINEFIEQTNAISEGEDGKSYLDLFLMPDPLGNSNQHSKLKFDEFKDVLAKPSSELNIFSGYDNFYTMPDGFVARQIFGVNNPYNLNSTFRHYENGFSWITLVFSSASAIESRSLIDGYKYADEFIKIVANYDGVILDINDLLFRIISSVGQHKKLTNLGNVSGLLYTKVGIHNVWRRIPFLDTEEYLKSISENGLPVIQSENMFIPPTKSFNGLKLIQSTEVDFTKAFMDEASQIIIPAISGLGIHSSILTFEGLWSAAKQSNDIVNIKRAKRVRKE